MNQSEPQPQEAPTPTVGLSPAVQMQAANVLSVGVQGGDGLGVNHLVGQLGDGRTPIERTGIALGSTGPAPAGGNNRGNPFSGGGFPRPVR
jgi:hypothetical protein